MLRFRTFLFRFNCILLRFRKFLVRFNYFLLRFRNFLLCFNYVLLHISNLLLGFSCILLRFRNFLLRFNYGLLHIRNLLLRFSCIPLRFRNLLLHFNWILIRLRNSCNEAAVDDKRSAPILEKTKKSRIAAAFPFSGTEISCYAASGCGSGEGAGCNFLRGVLANRVPSSSRNPSRPWARPLSFNRP